jgi:hypothetical protein
MSGRLEYKYLVPNSLVDQIRSDLQPYMEVDKFAEKPEASGYTVRSVYYDTPGFHCYQEKMDGVKVRKKFRIRGYDQPQDDSIVFLEIKRKYESFISKNRAPLLHKNLDALFAAPDLDKYIISSSKSGKEKSEAQRFLYHYYRLALRPAVLVVYDREAFMGKFDQSLRLTFDKNLRGAIFPSLSMLYDEHCLKPAMPRHFIFEVKFFRGTLPEWVRSILKRYELPRMALSKFTICLDQHKIPQKSLQMRSRAFSPVWSTF